MPLEPWLRALTSKMSKMGNDWISAPHSPQKASEIRDGLSRSMFGTCFDWLVALINSSLRLEAVP